MRSPHHLVTISRIPLSIIAIIFYAPESRVRFSIFIIVFLAAGISDYADGKIARYLNAQSEFGYILDGLCDRAFHVALILTFHMHGYCPTILAWGLIFRDIAIYALRLAQADWFIRRRSIRFVSIIHGYGLRLWAMILIGMDSLQAYTSLDPHGHVVSIILNIYISSILCFSYYGLWRLVILAVSDSQKLQEACYRWSKS